MCDSWMDVAEAQLAEHTVHTHWGGHTTVLDRERAPRTDQGHLYIRKEKEDNIDRLLKWSLERCLNVSRLA